MKGLSHGKGRRAAAALVERAAPRVAAATVKTARAATRAPRRALSLVAATAGERPERIDVALLVSESPALSAALERVLLPVGCGVETALEPAVVLQRLYDHPCACLLLDLRVPPVRMLAVLGGVARAGVEVPVFVVDESGDAVAELTPIGAVAAHSLTAAADDHALVARLRALRRGAAAGGGLGVRRDDSLRRLTPREREVLAGVVEGLPNKAIASSLGISDRTVEAHRSRLMAKLKARSVACLVRLVLENGGIDSLLGTAAPRP